MRHKLTANWYQIMQTITTHTISTVYTTLNEKQWTPSTFSWLCVSICCIRAPAWWPVLPSCLFVSLLCIVVWQWSALGSHSRLSSFPGQSTWPESEAYCTFLRDPDQSTGTNRKCEGLPHTDGAVRGRTQHLEDSRDLGREVMQIVRYIWYAIIRLYIAIWDSGTADGNSFWEI